MEVGLGSAVHDACHDFSFFSAIQDYDGMQSVFSLIEKHLDSAQRTTFLKAMIWTSLHAIIPDPVAHRRWIDEWHEIEVKPWRATHQLRPIRRRGGSRVRVGIIGLKYWSKESAFSSLINELILSLCSDGIELVLYLPDGSELPPRLQNRRISVRRIGRFDRAASEILADGLDVLLSLLGVTTQTAAPSGDLDQVWQLFVQRPARFLGMMFHAYPTWGAGMFDFAVLDPIMGPPTHDALVSERVERLACGLLFGALEDAPPVAPLPALSRGHVTFGCFNRPTKIERQFVEIWRDILLRLPTARLLLSNVLLQDDQDRTRIEALMADVGVARDRVDLMTDIPSRADFLARYAMVDISLDPLWFNGGLTSFESLWQGVPVLTCPSDYALGRITLLMLTQIGLTDWATPNVTAYVDRAVAAASDLDRLAALRAGLRDRVATSRLVDTAAYGAELRDLVVRIANGPERPR